MRNPNLFVISIATGQIRDRGQTPDEEGKTSPASPWPEGRLG